MSHIFLYLSFKFLLLKGQEILINECRSCDPYFPLVLYIFRNILDKTCTFFHNVLINPHSKYSLLASYKA